MKTNETEHVLPHIVHERKHVPFSVEEKRRSLGTKHRLAILILVPLCVLYYASTGIVSTFSGHCSSLDNGSVQWKPCAEQGEFECANVSVPLDYHNTSDERTLSIAVTRFPAKDRKNK
jgi:hypothetical protein